MEKFKLFISKFGNILELVIGYALMICLFVGGLGFIGYMIAFIIGGETATNICTWLYKSFYSCLIKISTITTLLCFVLVYVKGHANWENPVKRFKNKKNIK